MPSLEAFLQFVAGAGGASAILGIWLWSALKDNRELRTKLEALNAKVEARDAARLLDHQTALKYASDALAGIEPSDEEPKPDKPDPTPLRTPTGRHRR